MLNGKRNLKLKNRAEVRFRALQKADFRDMPPNFWWLHFRAPDAASSHLVEISGAETSSVTAVTARARHDRAVMCACAHMLQVAATKIARCYLKWKGENRESAALESRALGRGTACSYWINWLVDRRPRESYPRPPVAESYSAGGGIHAPDSGRGGSDTICPSSVACQRSATT
ncbi:uncharacterized protein LOC144122140 [Amblyomma americanum]